MELQAIFGTNVRNHRKSKGLTQEQLAERIDVSMETVGKIERGAAAPTFATAERLAMALEVHVSALFGTEGSHLPQGERGKLLASINHKLSKLTDEQLSKIIKMVDIFSGK